MDDREKLIELLTEECRRSCEERNLNVCSAEQCNSHKEKCVGHYADHLISNGVTVQKWIPVSERLPDGECLAVSMLNGPAYKEMLIGYVGEASNWDTGYECESDGEILPNVTHWMPLPEPPKECE